MSNIKNIKLNHKLYLKFLIAGNLLEIDLLFLSLIESIV